MNKHEMLDANMQMMLCNAKACQSELMDPLEHLERNSLRNIIQDQNSAPENRVGWRLRFPEFSLPLIGRL